MSHQPQRRISILIAACTIAGLGALCLASDTPIPSPTSPVPARGTASMRAYLNPETGKLETGASPAAVQFDPDTEQALRRDTIGLIEEHRADGSVLVDLQGRFQSVSMVRRTANGKMIMCTDDHQSAKKTLQGDLAKPTTPEVK
jgi:hypothetical protein